MKLPQSPERPAKPRQHLRGPVPTAAAEPRRVRRRRSRRSVSTGELLWADLCGRGLRLGVVAMLLIGMVAVGRSLWQEVATPRTARLPVSARQTASRASHPWWSALFDPALRHAAPAQASAPSLWGQKPAAGALVPVAHPAEPPATDAVRHFRKDESAASAQVAAVSLHRADAGTFSLGVPAPAASVTLSRQTAVRPTTGSSGPVSAGGSAPRKALVFSPVTTAAAPQPQAAGQTLYVDSSYQPTGSGNVDAGASYTVPAAGDAYSEVYDGYNGTGLITHSAGTLTVSGVTHLSFSSGSIGTYNLNGGVLTTGSVAGGSGTSTFNFNGGTLQANASSTTFLQGLTTANVQAGGASIDTNGNNITIGQALLHDTTAGAPATDGGLTVLSTPGGGTLTLTGANTYTGNTTVNGGTLAVASGGSITGGGSLTVDTTGAGAAAVTLVSGGSLSTGTAIIGNNGVGTFTHTGGSFTTNSSNFFLGLSSGSSGTYNLSGTGSLSTGTAVVGYSGTGIFVQTGGTFTTNGNALFVGGTSGSSGSYTLSGTGSLSTGGVVVGYEDSSMFTQSGGTFTTNGNTLFVGENTGGNGTYTLSGGTLTTGTTQVSYNSNTSSFSQSGGLHTTGTLTLSGETTSSNGTYSLQGGTLNVGTVNAGSGGVTGASTFNFNGGTLQAGQSTTSFLQGLATANVQSGGATGTAPGGAIIDTNGFNVTVGQALLHDTTANAPATDGGLTKLGAGTLSLSAANTYTGGTNVTAGTLLELNNGNALSTGTVAISSGATVALEIDSGSISQAGASTFTGAGTLAKTGAGLLAFGGNGGTVTIALSQGGLIDVQAGTLNGSSSYQADYTNNQGGLHIAAGATFDGVEGTVIVDALTGAGTLEGGYQGTRSTTIGVANGSGTFSGVIQDNIGIGTLSLTKVGTGTETLTGNNTYTGSTTVSGGTLAVAAGGGITGGGQLEVATGAGPATVTLVNGGSLSTSQVVVANAGTGTFTQNGGTFAAGTVVDLADQSGSTGTYNLNGGTLNTGQVVSGYFGGGGGTSTFNFNGGTLQANASGGSFLQGLTTANVQAGGVIIDTNGNNITVAQALLHDTTTGAPATDGGLYKLGSGTLTLSGANTFTGDTSVNAGTLAITGSIGVNGSSAAFYVDGGAGGASTTTISGTGTLTTSGLGIGGTGNGAFTQSGSSIVQVGDRLVVGDDYGSGSENTGLGTYNLEGGTLTTGITYVGDSNNSSASVFNQTGGQQMAGTLQFGYVNTNSAGTYNLSGGTLTVGQVLQNAGTGTFNFNGGTLQASASDSPGAASNPTTFFKGLSTANVQAGGAFIDSNGYNVTIAQALLHDTTANAPAIDGGLTVLDSAGGGTLTLTGANTYTGPTTLAAGVLNVGSAQALGNTSQLNFTGGTLQYSSANQTDYSALFSQVNNQEYRVDTNGQSVTFASGLASSGGSLTVLDSAGGGALTLTGANTYTGYTTVDGGTLAVAPGGSITGSSLLTVDAQGASPATVTLASGANLSTGTALIGVFATGTVTQSGGSFTNGGSLYLAYYSSGTGTYDLNGGVLTTGSVVGGDGAGTFNFNGGTLQAGGSNLNFFSGVSTASVQAGGAIIDTQGYNVTVAQNLVSGVNVKNLTVFTSAVAPTTDGGLTKLGTGTLTLTGASSYTGPTMVSAGTLAVNGSLTGTGMLTVFSAATLAGTGSVAGNVSIQANGTLAPGQAGAGTLSLDGNLTLTGTATAAFVLSGTAGNTQADAAGQINLGSQATLSLSLATGSPLTVGEKFYLLDTTGTSLVLGGFSNAPLTGSVFSEDGVTYQIDYLDTDPNDPGKTALNDVSVTILAIPEPGTWTLLFVGGTAMLGVALRRKRRRTQRLRSPDPCF